MNITGAEAPKNEFKKYPPAIKQLLLWNFIKIDEVEQRHIDEYLARLTKQ